MENKNNSFTNIRSLLGALAEAMNLIDPNVTDHHQQTAYLAYMIARAAGLPQTKTELTVYAALLHDVGEVLLESHSFDDSDRASARIIAKCGAYMLRGIRYFEEIAEIVDNCQLDWTEIQELMENGYEHDPELLKIASIIRLADYVSVLLQYGEGPVLNRAPAICEDIKKRKNTEFCPQAVDAFLDVAQLEFVWFDTVYHPSFLMFFTGELHHLSLEKTVDITQLMTKIIDYRSSFTAMHSAGVAASAMKLARLAGMSDEDCLMMKIAGNLHDIGKLKVPRAILEKPGRLTDEEFNQIKEHPYNTRLILMKVDGFEKITDWAGLHHEKLNGKGYPFHFGADRLDTGSRILTVADVFSAITEVRPYRTGMPKDMAMKILKENVEYGALCGEIVDLLFENYDEVDYIRDKVSRAAGKKYFESLDGSSRGATA